MCDDETNPVRYEMVQAQTVGIRIVLPAKLLVVDLRELEGCRTNKFSSE